MNPFVKYITCKNTSLLDKFERITDSREGSQKFRQACMTVDIKKK